MLLRQKPTLMCLIKTHSPFLVQTCTVIRKNKLFLLNQLNFLKIETPAVNVKSLKRVSSIINSANYIVHYVSIKNDCSQTSTSQRTSQNQLRKRVSFFLFFYPHAKTGSILGGKQENCSRPFSIFQVILKYINDANNNFPCTDMCTRFFHTLT